MSNVTKVHELMEKINIKDDILKVLVFFVLLILSLVLILTLNFAIFAGISYFILFLIDFFAGTAYLTLQNALICGLVLTIIKLIF